MVDVKEISKRMNMIKENNKEAKEGYFSNKYEINDYYGLRNLMDAVKEQLNSTVLRMIYAYPDPNVSAEWSTKEIRDRYRGMIHDAEKYGLEKMYITSSNKFTVDGVDFWMEIDGKKNNITIEKAIENGPWEEVFSKDFDSTIEMLDFYMDAIDANYRMPELADIYLEEDLIAQFINDKRITGLGGTIEAYLTIGGDYRFVYNPSMRSYGEYAFDIAADNMEDIYEGIGEAFDEIYSHDFYSDAEEQKNLEDYMDLLYNVASEYYDKYLDEPEYDEPSHDEDER